MHTPNKSNPRKTNPTQKTPDTAHCRQSVKQTTQRAKKDTLPDKNRSGSLNAMRSTRREAKDTREVERATRHETETLRTESRASNAQRDGNGTDEKSSEQCATERKRDVQENERNGTVGKNGREVSLERIMLAEHSKNSSKQPSRNSRTNLSHTLGRRREATARQSNVVHNGSITTNLTTNYFTAKQ